MLLTSNTFLQCLSQNPPFLRLGSSKSYNTNKHHPTNPSTIYVVPYVTNMAFTFKLNNISNSNGWHKIHNKIKLAVIFTNRSKLITWRNHGSKTPLIACNHSK